MLRRTIGPLFLFVVLDLGNSTAKKEEILAISSLSGNYQGDRCHA